MKLVFFGTSAFGIPSLNALKQSGFEIQAMVTVPDKPKGRHLKVENSPVKEWAIRNKIPHLEVARGQLNALREKLEILKPDLFIVISFGAILPETILSIPRISSLNVHSSLLPRWRGAAPIHWAIMNGDTETGVTVIRMTPQLDAGDILVQRKTLILEDDDIFSLETRLGRLAADALLDAISLLEKKEAVFKPQDGRLATTARKLMKEDGHIEWKMTAKQIHSRIRALKEWPTTYCFYRGKRLRVIESRLVRNPHISKLTAHPGTLLKSSPDEGIWVTTGDSVLEIVQLQAEGKKAHPAAEFLRGFPLTPGQILE